MITTFKRATVGRFAGGSGSTISDCLPSSATPSVEDMLRTAMIKLQKTLSSRRHKDTREICTAALAKLTLLIESNADLANIEVEMFYPFQLACLSGSSKPALAALDSLQSLLSCGFFSLPNGDMTDDRIEFLRTALADDADFVQFHTPVVDVPTVADQVVETICRCSSTIDDTQVQLQVIRCLLTSLTTGHIHNLHLILAIRTLFKIFSESRDVQNPRTAQAALTQIVNVVCQRMGQPPPAADWSLASHSISLDATVDDSIAISPDTSRPLDDSVSPDLSIDDVGGSTSHEEMRTSVPADPSAQSPVPSLSMHTPETVAQMSPRHSVSLPDIHENVTRSLDLAVDPQVALADGLTVLWCLCRLALTPVVPGSPPENKAIRMKRLALELILSIVQNATNALGQVPAFVKLLKSLLFQSLIQNTVSHVPRIFGLSLGIFLLLAQKFGTHLRLESGVYVDQILIRILESGNSSFEHKHRVLQVFCKHICADALVLLGIFLDFDCKVEERDVFAHLVDCLSKIAQGKYGAAEHASVIPPAQQLTLRRLALQALSTMVTVLRDWPTNVSPERLEMVDETMTTSSLAAQRNKKSKLRSGLALFNKRPKEGLQMLASIGHLEETPAGLAQFFLRQDGLSRMAIGDFLGDDKPFNAMVLKELLNSLDFKNLEIDAALKKFLSCFRLPGEAQKIDRMMENFSIKYSNDNPSRFASPDCAYVLAFSLIMLHTDAHSREIRAEKKMTREDFIRNNRGINNNTDLPRDLLESLYDRVVAEEWVLLEDETERQRLEVIQLMKETEGVSLVSALGLGAATTGKKKFEMFIRETKGMVTRSMEWISRLGRVTPTLPSSQVLTAQVKNLFEVACWPLLATFSVLLENGSLLVEATSPNSRQQMEESHNVEETVINGFRDCIVIACRFGLETERELFVSSLAKFTSLNSSPSHRQVMGLKETLCLQTLLEIALNEGNALGESWLPILQCVSQFERLASLGRDTSQVPMTDASTEASSGDVTGFHSQDSTSVDVNGVSFSAPWLTYVSFGTSRQPEPWDAEAVATEQTNAALLSSTIDANLVDLIYGRSTSLNEQSMEAFFRHLSSVSKSELTTSCVTQKNCVSGGSPPRLFSLQKLLEVSDFNLQSRPKFLWNRLWPTIQQHFTEAALHPSPPVAMFAVDGMRQLATKILSSSELFSDEIQLCFLRPFHIVMSHPKASEPIRELIVHNISHLASTRTDKLATGWQSILMVLVASTTVARQSLIQKNKTNLPVVMNRLSMSVDLMDKICRTQLTHIHPNFVDLLKGLSAVILLPTSSISGTTGAHLPRKALNLLHWIVSVAVGFDLRLLACQETFSEESILFVEDVFRSLDTPTCPTTQMMCRLREALTASWADNDGAVVPVEMDDPVMTEKHLEIFLLTPLATLSQLSSTQDIDAQCRSSALDILFQFLSHTACRFMPSASACWSFISRGVLFPMFDDLHVAVCSKPPPPPPPKTDPPTSSPRRSKLNNQSTRRSTAQLTNESTSIPQREEERPSWAHIQLEAALKNLVALLVDNFDCVDFLLSDALGLISSELSGEIVKDGNDTSPEPLARLGAEALKSLIRGIGPRCKHDQWTRISDCLAELFQRTSPVELLSRSGQFRRLETLTDGRTVPSRPTEVPLSPSSLPFDASKVVTKCVVQLLLTELTQMILMNTRPLPPNKDSLHYCIPVKSIQCLLDALDNSVKIARSFNKAIEWRHRLKTCGFMREMRQLPGLLKQERDGMAARLGSLSHLVNSWHELISSFDPQEECARLTADFATQFLACSRELTDHFLSRQQNLVTHKSKTNTVQDGPKTFQQLLQLESEREVVGLVPIFTHAVLGQGLGTFPEACFQRFAGDIFALCCDLYLAEPKEIRVAARTLLCTRMGGLLPNTTKKLV